VRGRNSLSWSQRIELDVEYVQTQSVLVDARIVVSTVSVLLTGAGAEGHPTDDPLATKAQDATPPGDDGDPGTAP
jgi:hypothetical protein